MAGSSSTPQPPPEPPELVAASEETLELVGTKKSIPLTVPESAKPVLEAASVGAKQALLSVEDIEAERDPGLVYAVYLNLPEGANDEERRLHHVGNVSLFGIEQLNDPDVTHEGGAPGLRHTFVASDVINRLNEKELWDPAAVEVTFEPLTLLPPPGEEESWAEETEELAAPPVKIGRVSLFIGPEDMSPASPVA
jgi:tyrosinase